MIAESIPAAVAEPTPHAMSVPASESNSERPTRLVSLDAYRGFVMLLMISAGLGIPKVAAHFPESAAWRFLAYETDHAAWRGCTLWDLIQPSFMFIVGVALPWSVAARRARESRFGALFFQALRRAFTLVALGLFLSSTGRRTTNFSFAIVLAQIGLGYPFLWLLAWTRPRTQALAAAGILLACWAAFALHPVPGADFDFHAAGLPADEAVLHGFEAHWQKHTNVAAAFDRWFLNLFPQETRFVFNAGGYQTLNFVPSLVTMIIGLLAGGLLRSECNGREKFRRLIVVGLALLLVGALWDLSGTCPMVKRIWTPSFALFSAGWALLLLALFYGVVDLKGRRRMAFPLVVAGMNSIALYCMSQLLKPWIRERMKLHFGQGVFELFGAMWAPMVEAACILALLWLAAWWMHRREIFLRI